MPNEVTHPGRRASAQARASRRSAGFTLTETLLATVVLAFSVTALLQAIGAGQMQTYEALHVARATALNEALLDELLSGPYHELLDWDGYAQPAGEIADAHDTAHAKPYQRFEQTVEVTPHTADLGNFGTVTGRLITITARDDRAGAWSVQRFVANAGDDMQEIYP